uniref:ATP-dependent RNA helicase n=1 Tax=Globisporangium ultimum (strain ATCC 200006 / CBS 805.95 / DAOM BR144) TaxID=431595 RepID=K3W7F1_GLOUD
MSGYVEASAAAVVDEQLQQQLQAAIDTKRFEAKYGLGKLSAQWRLAPEVSATLRGMNIHAFFPVQAVAIPKILDKSNDRITDICISAPTGSGKTLVYIVPIVQRLITRVVCRVRALIVLPSRDLAIQVHQIVTKFCANTPLKCGLAIGQSNFAAEQAALVGAIDHERALFGNSAGDRDGGHSLVDILVATPGRLVDHLEQTPGFTLQHLQILVVDEADRLLNQSYQDWIPKIYASIFNGHDASSSMTEAIASSGAVPMTCRRQDSINRRRIRTPLTRVLLSATLTRNPRKLASIGMSNAELTKIGRIDDVLADNAQEGVDSEDENNDDEDGEGGKEKLYSTPSNLAEYVIECDAGSKPLVLLEILSEYKGTLSIVFTASVNSTHRLARLLQLYSDHPERIREYSSSLTQKQRTALVAECKANKIETVVCSDAMARGMDIDNVSNVINYDVPTFIKTYIHRVGRTARAGRAGRSVTLVKTGQMKGLTRMLKKAENNKLTPFPLQKEHMKTLIPRYMQALEQLKTTLDAEKTGKLSATTTLRTHGGGNSSSAKKSHQQTTDNAEASGLSADLKDADKKRALSVLYEQLEKNLATKLQRKQ